MSTIRSSTGLASGLDIGGLVDALIRAQRSSARRLELRLNNVQTVQAGLGQLQAQLLSLSLSAVKLADRNAFSSQQVSNSDPGQLSVTSRVNAFSGSYQFQAVRLATTHRAVSRGFANADVQQVGADGQLVIARGGQLRPPVRLDLLNDGQGVRRGIIRITNRAGESRDVDLRNAVHVAEIVDAINTQAVGIRAELRGDHIRLTDLTGQSSHNLTVAEVAGGSTAADLGLLQSVASATLTGETVFRVTDQFTFDLLSGGNGLRPTAGPSGLFITLADNTQLSVDLTGAANLADVIARIHSHADNAGKLNASLVDGRMVLTDQTTGSSALQVANFGGSNATDVLGLNSDAAGHVLTGQLLTGGMNSVALHLLRGGRGITQPGELSLTDRTGATATIDLSQAQTLDDVLTAINSARTAGDVPLALRAELDTQGTGIVVRDTSGSTASNLKIGDVGSSTLAAELGISIDAASDSVSSGHLGLQRITTASSLATYSPRGTPVSTGSFRITDSAGNQAVINITTAVKTIGDVIDRINSASSLQVTARLNDTGDGFVLIDDAGGAGTLQVAEVGGRTAADLRLLGAATTGVDGKQRVVSRDALIVDVAATDTLNALSSKINAVGGTVRAVVVNTGAALNGFRLSLHSTQTGSAGQFVVQDLGANLGFAHQEAGRDAVLRVGSDPATAFLKTSSSNTFIGAAAGLDVTLLQASNQPATVTTSPDTQKVQTTLQEFVAAYNAYIDKAAELTKYDTATQSRAALQGTGLPLVIQNRFNALINRRAGPESNAVRSLADVGLKLTVGGKLSLDANRLNEALQKHPDQVRSLFTDTSTGFGTQMRDAINRFTAATTGPLALQSSSLQATADSLTRRIEQLDALLESRRTRLERQFVNMETILSGLQSQQTSLNGLAMIIANLRSSTS